MPKNKNLIEASTLYTLLGDSRLVVLDCSWYLPSQNRDGRNEFNNHHIDGAQFFDIDKVSEQASNLPHMIPSESFFEEQIQALGVSNTSVIVVYDGAGLFSAARVWWMFHLFGHEDVLVLNGGLPEWIDQGFDTTSTQTEIIPGKFKANLNSTMVADMQTIRINCNSRDSMVLDARPHGRFSGEAPEPRPELPSGHMPGAISLPFSELMDQTKLKSENDLRQVFNDRGIDTNQPIITSCGSGVTAAIIILALESSGYGMQKLYDGSWTEWASNHDNPIEMGK